MVWAHQRRNTDLLTESKNYIQLSLTSKKHTGKHTYKLRVKGWKSIYQANGNWKQPGIVVMISSKVDFTPKLARREKGHYLLVNGKIH